MPFVAYAVLAGAASWCFDVHRPAPWPDASAPWFEQAQALAPTSALLDALNHAWPITPDLPAGSVMVLLALGLCVVAASRAIGVPGWLAVAVAIGTVFTRSLWSTTTAGRDALPVLLVAIAVWTTARPARRLVTNVVACITALTAPPAAWMAIPAVVLARTGAIARAAAGVGLGAIALCVHTFLLWHAWTSVPCLDGSSWTRALLDVWRPGTSADASPWIAIRQWASVLAGDVHLFGIVVAAVGLATHSPRESPLWTPTMLAFLLAVAGVAVGVLPPALGAALLLPWWAPWFGAGLLTVVRRTRRGPQQRLAAAFAIVTAAGLPALRSAVVVPAPWTSGMPTISRAAIADMEGVVAVHDAAQARRLRRAGATLVPADTAAITACVRGGTTVSVLGASIRQVEHAGVRTDDVALHVPMSAVLQDLRRDQLVALAIAPASLGWIGPQGLGLLDRLALDRDAQTHADLAIATVARTDRGGETAATRGRAEVNLPIDATVGGRSLLAPLAVTTQAGEAIVDSPPRRLAAGRHAALVVFDRAHDITLATTGAPRPGLPVSLGTHMAWRRAVVMGVPDCVQASAGWTSVPGIGSRITVPIGAASSRHPLLAYVSSDRAVHAAVHGLDNPERARTWDVAAFDTSVPDGAAQLAGAIERDGLDRTQVPRGRWVSRVAVAPRDAWSPPRVMVSAGTPDAAWVVRLAGRGLRDDTRAVCRAGTAGERLFGGRAGSVDDDTARQVTLRVEAGWHEAEHLHGAVHQWTSQPRATAVFELPAPRALVLEMDATAATVGSAPQPLTVRINDQVIDTDWRGARRVDVPAALLRAGTNTLTLEVPQTVHPPQDARALGVLVRASRLIDPTRP